MEKSSRRYTNSELYPAGEIDVCENLDVVHFRGLVVIQGYLAHKKPPPLLDNHRALGIGLL
jgi:hypothetical protein